MQVMLSRCILLLCISVIDGGLLQVSPSRSQEFHSILRRGVLQTASVTEQCKVVSRCLSLKV